MNTFFIQVWQETLTSLGETLKLFEGGEANWFDLFVLISTKLLVSGILISIFLIVFLILRYLQTRVLSRFNLGADIVHPFTLSLRYMMLVMTILALFVQYGVPTSFTSAVARAALMLFAFYGAWLILDRFLSHYLKTRGLDPSLVQLFENIASVVLSIFAVTTVLSQFGINVFSIITTLGVVGIAVGFAAQETLSNFIAGITLLVERPFRIGDWVKIDQLVGKVREINLRTTRLQTRDNEILVMPNAKVAGSDIINLSAGGPLRVRILLGIAYKEEVSKTREVLLPLLKEHSRILKKPAPGIRLIELADSSQNLELFYWIAPNDIDHAPKISYDLLESVKTTLDQASIEIPFPHMQLLIEN